MNGNYQFQKAETIFRALVQGIDPQGGGELTRDTIINRIDVNRAMHTALCALEQIQARLLRRAQLPPSVGKTWTEDEVQQLRNEFTGSEPIPEIAARHGRTVRAIESRLERLGLLRPDQRVTTDSFVGTAPPKESE
jgi:hypothetical protein